ncbi:MAG: hypothetical protein JF609_12380 [Verrucomicrobia bacterium]|nr:hypothetical protein [Verrucomicrobiota bacterium]
MELATGKSPAPAGWKACPTSGLDRPAKIPAPDGCRILKKRPKNAGDDVSFFQGPIFGRLKGTNLQWGQPLCEFSTFYEKVGLNATVGIRFFGGCDIRVGVTVIW